MQIWLVSKLVPYFGAQGIVVWLYALTLVPTGLIAEWFLKKRKLLQEKLRLRNLSRMDKKLMRDLFEKRALLLKMN